MSASAAQRTTYRPYLPPLGAGAFEAARGSLREWRAAFRISGSPQQHDGNFSALLLLGRD